MDSAVCWAVSEDRGFFGCWFCWFGGLSTDLLVLFALLGRGAAYIGVVCVAGHGLRA